MPLAYLPDLSPFSCYGEVVVSEEHPFLFTMTMRKGVHMHCKSMNCHDLRMSEQQEKNVSNLHFDRAV